MRRPRYCSLFLTLCGLAVLRPVGFAIAATARFGRSGSAVQSHTEVHVHLRALKGVVQTEQPNLSPAEQKAAPVMGNPLSSSTDMAGSGIVRFPFVVDGRFNPFVNTAPYNVLRGTVFQVPGPPLEGHSEPEKQQGLAIWPLGVTPPPPVQLSLLQLSTKARNSAGIRNRLRERIRRTPPPLPLSSDTTWFLPKAPFQDPFTGEEDPILNFNPWNPYAVHGKWTRRNVPPGQQRSYVGPITAHPPSFPNHIGIPIMPGDAPAPAPSGGGDSGAPPAAEQQPEAAPPAAEEGTGGGEE